MSRRDEILEVVETVELLSTPALSALQVLNDPDADSDTIANVLQMDPALTTNVLRFANSAYFGCSKQIDTVKEAFVRLGMKTITRMLYMSAASELSQRPVQGYDLAAGQLWKHLITTAIATEILSNNRNIKAPQYAFTAGLLHDVGKIVLGTYIEVDVAPIQQMAIEEQLPFDLAEMQVLGISHAEVGAALLKKWNIPETIVENVRWHHEPNNYPYDDRLTVDLIHIADSISMMMGDGLGVDGLYYAVCPESEKRLGMKRGEVDSIICSLLDEVNKIEQIVETT